MGQQSTRAAGWILAGIIGIGFAGVAGTAGGDTTTATGFSDQLSAQFDVGDGASAMGHPALKPGVEVPRGAAAFDPDAPPDSPLERGWYVNFESPPIDAIALSEDGGTLFAANTPNGTLVIVDVSGPAMQRIGEVPTGLEPVSVAVQPGTGGRFVWVCNFVSDTVSVVDTQGLVVVDVVRVGDEPASVTFSDDGATAFVVTQGPPVFDPGDEIRQTGGVVAIDTSSRQVVGKLLLGMNTPRRSVMVPGRDRLVVAALRSGNNTTVVGEPFLYETTNQGTVPFPNLANVSNLSLTQGLFADPGLSPWPDVSPVPGATFVARIVRDRGETIGNVWHDIVETLNGGAGGDTPDPAVLQQYMIELPTVINAFDALVETITDAKDTSDHDLAVIDVSDPAAMTLVSMTGHVGATLTGLALRPAGGAGVEVLATAVEPFNTTRHEPTLNGNFAAHEVVRVSDLLGAPVVQRTDLHAGIPNFGDVSQFNQQAWDNALANPTDVEFNSAGDVAFVAALGSSRIGAVDADTGAALGVVDTASGPRSLAYDAGSGALYALSRTSMMLERFDVSVPSQMTRVGSLAIFNPEPAPVRLGREFLHSSLLANNGGFSCATCHFDGVFDAIAWDLGNPDKTENETKPFITANINNAPCQEGGGENHPLKGPMVTLSLQGLRDHTELHWRGDREEFQSFQGAFSGLLGGAEPTDGEMDTYTAFINSIAYPPNPFRNPDNTFKDPVGATGRGVYMNSCNVCHNIAHDGALSIECEPKDVAFNLGINGGLFAQVQLVPQLRGIYKKFDMDLYNGFGLLHDGREERELNDHPLDTFLQTFFPGIVNNGLDDDLIAFVQGFQSNVMPIVGFQTVAAGPSATGVFATPGYQQDIDLMIAQHDLFPSRCGVIAKGIVNGEQRGFYLFTLGDAVPVFRSDRGTMHTLAQLLAGVQDGDSLVFTAVPPGSGRRLGVDQDDDCVSDLLDPDPQNPMINPDYNHDGRVDTADLGALLGAFGTVNEAINLNADPIVDTADLGILIGAFGVCP
ncbi:MAG: hypothetical protein H6813_04790 [Phycisphaeraceae bacterium]|nr:hypothetical protein [Phycisphaeraceae bacterium]